MRKQTFTLTVETDEKGQSRIGSLNEGFSPLELIGILEFKIHDIYQQMQHQVSPPKIVRQVTHVALEEEIDDLRKVVVKLASDLSYISDSKFYKNE